MAGRNVILISLDEVRPDHLSCYGYDRIRTPNIDSIAENGVLFEECVAAACFTPLCMASVITGCYHDKHTVRDPYCYIRVKTLAQVLKEHGYNTAGFVGNGVLGQKHGFAQGFDLYDEPTKEHSFDTWQPDRSREKFYGGNWWIDRFFEWFERKRTEPFFVWGHYYHTHRGAEKMLLEKGYIEEGVLSDMLYADAKIKLADEILVGRLLSALREYGIEDNTTLVLMSDHGTNMGEHPAKPIHYVPDQPIYPQHLNLFDVNVRIALIMKDRELPKGLRVPGMVRSVDVMPTILDLVGVPADGLDLDGISLLGAIRKGKAEGLLAYAENLQEWESEDNALTQSLRTSDFKFIRNLADGTEQYYDLKNDPGEKNNIIEEVRKTKRQELLDLRKIMNVKILKGRSSNVEFSEEERKTIQERLRRLGYTS